MKFEINNNELKVLLNFDNLFINLKKDIYF